MLRVTVLRRQIWSRIAMALEKLGRKDDLVPIMMRIGRKNFGPSAVTLEAMEAIAAELKLNGAWLLTGEGSMLRVQLPQAFWTPTNIGVIHSANGKEITGDGIVGRFMRYAAKHYKTIDQFYKAVGEPLTSRPNVENLYALWRANPHVSIHWIVTGLGPIDLDSNGNPQIKAKELVDPPAPVEVKPPKAKNPTTHKTGVLGAVKDKPVIHRPKAMAFEMSRNEGNMVLRIEFDKNQLPTGSVIILTMPQEERPRPVIDEEGHVDPDACREAVFNALTSKTGIKAMHLDELVNAVGSVKAVMVGITEVRAAGFKVVDSGDADMIYTLHE